MANVFSKAPSASFPFSVFDLGYTSRFTCDMGELIPVFVREVYPGEKYKTGVAFNIKTMPLVAPVMGDISVYFHYFFVPYRVLQNRATMASMGDHNTFEDYITGLVAENTVPLVSGATVDTDIRNVYVPLGADGKSFGLSDYLGFPLGSLDGQAMPNATDYSITQFVYRAYGKIYADYYADENLQSDLIDLFDTMGKGSPRLPNRILRRCWSKDYFTSTLPWQQKGTPVALDVSSTLTLPSLDATLPVGTAEPNLPGYGDPHVMIGGVRANRKDGETWETFIVNGTTGQASGLQADMVHYNQLLSRATVTSSTFDIAQFRLVNAIQCYMERMAVSGTRYVEYLRGQYGFAPRDDSVDRAVYLGGYKAPLLIQQVQQTSSTFGDSTPQGTLTGQGYSIDASKIFSRRFYEHGIVMGLMSIMPRANYSDGIDRNFIKRNIYDWHLPVFNNLSEEEVLNCEVSVANANPMQMFGYQMRKGYRRWSKSISCGGLQHGQDLAYWSLQRDLSAGAALNSDFIICKPSKDFLAYPDGKTFICEIGNICRGALQLPYIPEPSLRTY